MNLNRRNPYIRIAGYSALYQLLVYLVVLVAELIFMNLNIDFTLYPVLFLNIIIMLFMFDRMIILDRILGDSDDKLREEKSEKSSV